MPVHARNRQLNILQNSATLVIDPLVMLTGRLGKPKFNPFRNLERLRKARAGFLKPSGATRP